MWSNGPLVLFHGTDTSALSAYGSVTAGTPLTGFQVNLALCRPATDFGRGFYTTTSLTQAQEWANSRTRRIRASGAGTARAVVIRFDVDRDWLSTLQSLVFIRPSRDYWDLITYCRTGGTAHGRAISNGLYDVVYGLVTLWPQRLVIQDCDQISFHSAPAAAGLPAPTVEGIAPATKGVFP
jgi:Protein of unknown function (DUF3990)